MKETPPDTGGNEYTLLPKSNSLCFAQLINSGIQTP